MKKYTSQHINSLSWQEWNELMAKELNAAGFRTKEFVNGEWAKTGKYNAHEDNDEPWLFAVQMDAESIEYLKQLGLINNGRCMQCGKPIIGAPGRFTDGFDHNRHYHICQDCVSRGKRISVNHANKGGCMAALLLLPVNLIANLFTIIR